MKIKIISLALLALVTNIVQPLSVPEEPGFQNWRNGFLLPETRPLQIPPTEPAAVAATSKSQVSTFRDSKLFPYLLVQFPNDACSNVAGTQQGICVSAKQCREGGGTTIGVCAQGFGACCKYVKTCGPEGGDIIVKANSTEIHAGNKSSTCRFILPKGKGICQVRLDLLKFEFGQGSNGNCGPAKVEIGTNGGETIFKNLCGDLTGQHLYFTYGTAEKIFVHSASSPGQNHTYSIRVSYLRCGSRESVPAHCTQVYTGSSGIVKSLNWPHQQLNNQEYTVCVADPRSTRKNRMLVRQSSSSVIKWTTCGSNDTSDFFISGKLSGPKRILQPDYCDNTDYIQFFGGNKQCGRVFREEVLSSTPYLMHVKFNEKEIKAPEQLQGQGHLEVVVSKPESGCEYLNTEEATCVELQLNEKLCKCAKTRKRPNSKKEPLDLDEDDEGNTGFCLKYEIIE